MEQENTGSPSPRPQSPAPVSRRKALMLGEPLDPGEDIGAVVCSCFTVGRRQIEAARAGRDRIVVGWKGWKICPLVCYDLRFPVFSRNRHDPQRGFDFDCLLFVANWPSARAYAWRTLLRARAIENLSYCVGVNRVGVDGNQLPYSGDSAVLDYLGQAMADLGAQEQVVTVSLDHAALQAFREKFPAWMDADAFDLE